MEKHEIFNEEEKEQLAVTKSESSNEDFLAAIKFALEEKGLSEKKVDAAIEILTQYENLLAEICEDYDIDECI